MELGSNQMKKIKVAVVGTRGVPASYGGIEKHCEDLYSLLADLGYEITIYGRSNEFVIEKDRHKGINTQNIPAFNLKGFDTFAHSFASTLLASFSDADIIHFHAQGPAIFSWIPRILAPSKKIGFTCHGIDWQRDKWNKFSKFVIKLGEIASSAFPHLQIAVSQDLANYYRNTYQKSFHFIPNGVNITPFSGFSSVNKSFDIEIQSYFLFVGRLVPEKAPDTLIKAFKEIKTSKKLVIVGGSAGTNTYVNELKELARGDNRIIFTSYLYGKDLLEVYANSMAYISASRLEGHPITLLEAMSFSKPVLLSNIEPHLETVNLATQSSGFVFEVNNIQDCKQKIEKFLSLSKEEVEKMGESSKEIVKSHFNWEKIVHKTDKAIKSIL